jgi:hypothetical protein
MTRPKHGVSLTIFAIISSKLRLYGLTAQYSANHGLSGRDSWHLSGLPKLGVVSPSGPAPPQTPLRKILIAQLLSREPL